MMPVILGVVMKKLAIGISTVIALIGTPAFAADMAVKAPPPAPAPAYNWTGWYAGINLGASFGSVKTDFNVTPVTITSGPFSGIVPGFASSNTEYPSGFMGGGQIGYNWQLSPIWVVGLEADFQGALEKDSNTLSNPFTGTGSFTLTGTTVTNYSTKIDWFGTVRARLGYLWGDGKVLSYVTGGLAYARVDLEGTSTTSGTFGGFPFSITHPLGHSHVNAGWTVGYGMEGALATPGWTWKVESLYMDLGYLNDTDADTFVCLDCSVTGAQVITHTHFTDAILRGGLNYQFH